jgi:hypothetical protein
MVCVVWATEFQFNASTSNGAKRLKSRGYFYINAPLIARMYIAPRGNLNKCMSTYLEIEKYSPILDGAMIKIAEELAH